MISNGWQTFFLLDTSNMLPSRLVNEKLRGRKLKRMPKVGPTHVHRMDAPGSFNDHQALNDSSRWGNAQHHWKGFPCYTRLRQSMLLSSVKAWQPCQLCNQHHHLPLLAMLLKRAGPLVPMKNRRTTWKHSLILVRQQDEKLHPKIIAKERRRALGSDGKRQFKATGFLRVHSRSSIFGGLDATDKDIFATAEEANFQEARGVILTAMNLEHPIVYDQYNICAVVCNTLKNLKTGLLRMLCKKLNLKVSVGARRKKYSHKEALTGLPDGQCGRSGSDY